MQAPDGLLISIERLMLDITDNLDPFIGLKLTGITRQVAEISYIMGHQDGNRGASTCPTCPFKSLG
jgi:hypothetical protein